MKLSTTGIPALDMFLQGGLPPGYTTLLLAPAGGGSEIFAKQFASGGKGVSNYITTDETEAEVKDAMKEGGWPTKHIEITDIQSAFAQLMLAEQRPDTESVGFDPRSFMESTSKLTPRTTKGPRRSDDYLGSLIEPFEQGKRPARMVIHSLDFYLSLYSLEKVAAVLTALKAANSAAGGQLLMVLAKGAHGDKAERRLELLADCLIELEVNRKGTTFERFFLVKKVKNRPNSVGVSTYALGPQGFTLETLERIV